MLTSKNASVVLAAVTVMLALAGQADAVVRRTNQPLFLNRLAVSAYFGEGLPVGDFASERVGDGNHDTGAPDWAFEGEYFVGRTASIGFSAANTTYQDKTFSELETHLSTYSGFLRVVMPTATSIRPYLRAGMGAVQVQFQDPETRIQADYEMSFQVGGGLLWMWGRSIGINGQALYYFADTDDTYIPEVNAIVGFNTTYWAFSGGISLFFP